MVSVSPGPDPDGPARSLPESPIRRHVVRQKEHSMPELHAPGWVAASIRQGLSANAALSEFRNAGGSMRRSVWLKLYAEQRVAVDSQLMEMTAPLSAIPSRQEMVPMTTKRKAGYLQTLDIYTKLKGTDVVTVKPFMFSGSDLMSRGEALTKALTMMQTAVDDERYEETVLGGVYTGTRIMTPGETS